MSNFAIVIGIDKYSDRRLKEQSLTAAVSGSLSFAAWALDKGGVAPENLILLLGADAQDLRTLSNEKPEWERFLGKDGIHGAYQDATADNIRDAVDRATRAQNLERLFFYYAGHGTSAPGASDGRDLAPVLIPTDKDVLDLRSGLLIPLSEITQALHRNGPREQFFFIDACRGFELKDVQLPIGSSCGPQNAPRLARTSSNAQYLLLATSPGQASFEVEGNRTSVFNGPLIEALSGQSPAMRYEGERDRYVVRLSTLNDYISKEIAAGAIEQWPEPITRGATNDPELVSFDAGEIKPVTLKVFVDPALALQVCKVKVWEITNNAVIKIPEKTNLPYPANFALYPRTYWITAEPEEGYIREECTHSIYVDRTVEFLLEDVRLATGPAESDGEDEPSVIIGDPYIPLVIVDSKGEPLRKGLGSVRLPKESGLYWLQVLVPEGPRNEQPLPLFPELAPTTSRRVLIGEPQIQPDQLRMLRDLGIRDDLEGNLDLREPFGLVGLARLASILGFAAFSAIYPAEDLLGLALLQGIGITPFQEIADDEAGLIILIGLDGPLPSSASSNGEIGFEDFLSRGAVTIYDYDSSGKELKADPNRLTVLPPFPAAAEFQATCPPGLYKVDLSLPGFATTHYALAGLGGYVTVLVVVLEAGGMAVRHYLLPYPAKDATTPGTVTAMARYMRRADMVQRYYAMQKSLPEELDIADLLNGRIIDPVLTCLIGYALLDTDEQDLFAYEPKMSAASSNIESEDMLSPGSGELLPLAPPAQNKPQVAPLHLLLQQFPELPDVHVLAGLYDQDEKQKNYYYECAVQRGLPVLAEGVRVLKDWYERHPYTPKELMPPMLREPAWGLLLGMPWSAWVSPQRIERSTTLTTIRSLAVWATAVLTIIATIIGFSNPRTNSGIASSLLVLPPIGLAIFLIANPKVEFIRVRLAPTDSGRPTDLSPSRLAPSSAGGLFGGMIGGAVSGIILALAWAFGPQGAENWQLALVFLFAVMGGATLGFICLETINQLSSRPWYRRVRAHFDFVEIAGGILGGIITAVVLGAFGAWFFGRVVGNGNWPWANPPLFILGIAIGVVSMTIGSLFYDYKGHAANALPAFQIVGIILLAIAVLSGIVFLFLTEILRFLEHNLIAPKQEWSLYIGAIFLALLIGIVAGGPMGVILYVYRKWKE